MKILFDHQVFWLQQYGGISRLLHRTHGKVASDRKRCRPLPLVFGEPTSAVFKAYQGGSGPTKPWAFDMVKWGQQKTKKDLIGYLDHRASKKALNQNDFDISIRPITTHIS